MTRIAVIIPAYGKEELTHTAVADIAREDADPRHTLDCLVVDNQGGYEPRWREQVLRPGRNLGWLDGTNAGLEEARTQDYDAYVLMNNDVRLSRGFFAGLVRAQRLTRAGLVAPAYDSHFRHQNLVGWEGPIEQYEPRRLHWPAAFVDGPCMYLPHPVVETVGLLDPRFNPHGWGGEMDLSFRVWDAGYPVVVTALAFLHHQLHGTALDVHGWGHREEAYRHMREMMRDKYGAGPAGWGPRAGLDGETNNTQPVAPRARLLSTVKLEAGRLRRRRS